MDRNPSNNVASAGLELSAFIKRQSRRRRPLLVAASNRRASRFVAGESGSPRRLMRYRRPAFGPTADGVAHGPAKKSASAASALIVRSDKTESSAPDRSLRPFHADRAAHMPAADLPRLRAIQSEDRSRSKTRMDGSVPERAARRDQNSQTGDCPGLCEAPPRLRLSDTRKNEF